MKTNEPVDWLEAEFNKLSEKLDRAGAAIFKDKKLGTDLWLEALTESKAIIKSKLDSQKAEAYERGYQHGHKIGYEEGISGYQPDTQSSQDREE